MTLKYNGFLSGTTLKIIAAVTMLIDHFGFLFGPFIADEALVYALRAIGRITMPIFAFFIAEGFRYTRDRKKYFLILFLLGTVCNVVYYVAMQQIYICILTTFSVSVAILYAYDGAVNSIKNKDGNFFLYFSGFAAAVAVAVFIDFFAQSRGGTFDYGWVGTLLPLFAYIVKKNPWRLLVFAVGVLGVSTYYALTKENPIYWFTLLSLAFIALYNGKRGKYGLKYFFYLFYPLHLLALEGLLMLFLMTL